MRLYTPQVDAIAGYIGRGSSAKARHPDIVARFAALLGDLRRVRPREPEGDPAWSFWVRSERGPISAFGDYQEFLDAGEVASLAEFESLWHEYYPSPTKWHEATVVCFQRRVFVGVDPDCRFEVDLEAQSVEGADVRNEEVEAFVVWLAPPFGG